MYEINLAADGFAANDTLTFLSTVPTNKGKTIALVYAGLLKVWTTCLNTYTENTESSSDATETAVINIDLSRDFARSFSVPTSKRVAQKCMQNINILLDGITKDNFVGALLACYLYGRGKDSGETQSRGDLHLDRLKTALDSINSLIK